MQKVNMKNNIFFLSLCFALCLILMGCASKDTTHFTGQPEVSASAADTSEIQNTESAEAVTESAPPEEMPDPSVSAEEETQFLRSFCEHISLHTVHPELDLHFFDEAAISLWRDFLFAQLPAYASFIKDAAYQANLYSLPEIGEYLAILEDSDKRTSAYFAVSAINQSTEKLESADGAQRLIAYNEYEKPDAVFPEELPDAYFSVILSSMEAAYSAELSFENVGELTEAELYTSFQLFSSEDDLLNCWNEAAQAYCYTKDMICSTLDRYYNGYTYRIEEDPFYAPSYDAIVTTVVGGFGGGLYVDDLKIQSDGSKCIIEGTVRDGNGEEIARKEYTFEFYNGGFYICSIRVCAK